MYYIFINILRISLASSEGHLLIKQLSLLAAGCPYNEVKTLIYMEVYISSRLLSLEESFILNIVED